MDMLQLFNAYKPVADLGFYKGGANSLLYNLIALLEVISLSTVLFESLDLFSFF